MKKGPKTGGRLIAVDGANGRAVIEHAQQLTRGHRGIKGVSQWDASGLFEQLLAEDDDIVTTPRILLLLYAADLAFRLRWEVEPALAEGDDVIAAPYIETAVAFGRAHGVPGKWLSNLFRFARKPDRQLKVSGGPAKRRGSSGFVEFASSRSRGRARVR
jgi:hypothetical protein